MKKIFHSLIIAASLVAVAAPSLAQPANRSATEVTILTDALIEKLSQAASEESKKQGVDISISIVDEKGWPLYFKRYGDAILVTTVLVPNKAYTSAVLKMPSGDLAKLTRPGEPLYGINTADPRVVLLAGGYPLVHNGKLVGAIGVGGGTWDQDEKIGQHILSVFNSEAGKR